MSRRVVVFDFDGTVCLGDAPVTAYADAVLRRAAGIGVDDAREAVVRSSLDDFLAGRRVDSLESAPDGYHAVAVLAEQLGLDRDERSAAYLESRAAVDAGEAAIEAPPGLAALLDELSPLARLVLVTNAPHAGVDVLLERLGLGGRFDEVVGDAGKPDGMGAILDRLLAEAGIVDQPGLLLSVGDIWRNDLEPAAERGCATAHIDRFGRGDGNATFRAATIEQLYPRIREWAAAR